MARVQVHARLSLSRLDDIYFNKMRDISHHWNFSLQHEPKLYLCQCYYHINFAEMITRARVY